MARNEPSGRTGLVTTAQTRVGDAAQPYLRGVHGMGERGSRVRHCHHLFRADHDGVRPLYSVLSMSRMPETIEGSISMTLSVTWSTHGCSSCS